MVRCRHRLGARRVPGAIGQPAVVRLELAAEGLRKVLHVVGGLGLQGLQVPGGGESVGGGGRALGGLLLLLAAEVRGADLVGGGGRGGGGGGCWCGGQGVMLVRLLGELLRGGELLLVGRGLQATQLEDVGG